MYLTGSCANYIHIRHEPACGPPGSLRRRRRRAPNSRRISGSGSSLRRPCGTARRQLGQPGPQRRLPQRQSVSGKRSRMGPLQPPPSSSLQVAAAATAAVTRTLEAVATPGSSHKAPAPVTAAAAAAAVARLPAAMGMPRPAAAPELGSQHHRLSPPVRNRGRDPLQTRRQSPKCSGSRWARASSTSRRQHSSRVGRQMLSPAPRCMRQQADLPTAFSEMHLAKDGVSTSPAVSVTCNQRTTICAPDSISASSPAEKQQRGLLHVACLMLADLATC